MFMEFNIPYSWHNIIAIILIINYYRYTSLFANASADGNLYLGDQLASVMAMVATR